MPYRSSATAAVRSAAAGRALPGGRALHFKASERSFDRSLGPWYRAIAQFKAAFPGTQVATTEPVGNYMLQAAGTKNLTPFGFQADIMNGVDPSPQPRQPADRVRAAADTARSRHAAARP